MTQWDPRWLVRAPRASSCLAIVSMRVVGRRAARHRRPGDRTARAQRGALPGHGARLERHHGHRRRRTGCSCTRARRPSRSSGSTPSRSSARRVRPHPPRRPRHRREQLRVDARRAGQADRIEFRLRHADGSWRVVEAVATNLLDDPSVEGIVISARDLTDRRRAEAELREAQERFRSAFEHAPIGMALMALDGRLFRVNRALAQILGRGESRAARCRRRSTSRHPDDSRPARARCAACSRARRRARSSSSATCTTTGIPVWVAVSVSLVRDLEGRADVPRVPDRGHHRATGKRRRARAPGDPRPAHRAAEPHAVRRAPRPRACPRRPATTSASRCCSSTSTASRS